MEPPSGQGPYWHVRASVACRIADITRDLSAVPVRAPCPDACVYIHVPFCRRESSVRDVDCIVRRRPRRFSKSVLFALGDKGVREVPGETAASAFVRTLATATAFSSAARLPDGNFLSALGVCAVCVSVRVRRRPQPRTRRHATPDMDSRARRDPPESVWLVRSAC